MGITIHGWVEVRDMGEWIAVINAGGLVGSNYDMIGMLFGIRNYTGFEPIAEGRGLPGDIHWRVRQEYEALKDISLGETWIAWPEIAKIDWDEWSPDFDIRIHEYIIGPDGTEKYWGKALLTSELDDEDYRQLTDRGEVRKGNRIYRRERLRRKDCLSESWQALFELMEVLAKHYGDENVRLVVWFTG